ncbi:delta-1-pyrroline-5-carboxylate dehydrogenase 12A1, mitochondrial-like isoform X1 [Lycium barbarum]|uniref:delta-1-pyrroline-5-carboxylate dehydrogenase 12A1, mitochondrial-like isoform X1 n=1 Tax=Lycium barbarum TaxID=112863 RepID=UPI00293EF59F|nr:delta-1-pyrroline-5-carboxylate dehydrogenase 12A1, mitochondrial-like isoform X1 [Lycium barbarum]XP_060201614.1 delta-1-pyrroline-5-carboxylate dehydrogenase 12A1, mitochondrial-like isoform X1 [Lycium barbarum]
MRLTKAEKCAKLKKMRKEAKKQAKEVAENSRMFSEYLKLKSWYLMLGDVSTKAAHALGLSEVSDFFAKLIQRMSPKSFQQALGEVSVTQKFLENFRGDQVRFLARSFAVPGNHLGQQSYGFRWPYGPVAVITPFNFPLLQLMGALYMDSNSAMFKWICILCLRV